MQLVGAARRLQQQLAIIQESSILTGSHAEGSLAVPFRSNGPAHGALSAGAVLAGFQA